MTTKYSPNRSFNPFDSKRTDEWNLNDLTSNILAITNPKAPIQAFPGLPKAKYSFFLHLLDQVRDCLIGNEINANQMVLGFDSIVFGLLSGDSLDYCQFVLLIYQVLA